MKLPILLFLAAVSALPAATLTVTSTADSGPGSLRDTIANANHGDIITFGGAAFTGPESTVTIRLTSGDILTHRLITIQGIANASGGNKVVISGDSDASGTPTPGDTRAFRFQPSTSGSVTVSRLTIRDCNSENAISVNGGFEPTTTNFIFQRCNFIDNFGSLAGAIFSNTNTFSFEFDRCRFEGNISDDFGGAMRISYAQHLSISLCDFIANKVTSTNGFGGALDLSECPSVEIDRCLFSENEVLNVGGAITMDNSSGIIRRSLFQGNIAKTGGAIYFANFSESIIQPTVTHCTFSGNQTTASGSAVRVRKLVDLLLEHCTITANVANSAGNTSDAGAVCCSEDANIRFSSNLIAGNTDGRASGTHYPDVQGTTEFPYIITNGTLSSLRGNVIGDSTGSGRTFEGRGDDVGTPENPIPAGVLPLADNGGATLTHALQPLAAAVNFAETSTATEDQRGQPRPSGSEPDAGAFERQLISFDVWAADRLAAYPVSERQARDDADGDRVSNGVEFIQGTAPAIPNLPLDRIERDEDGIWYSYTVSNEADIDSLTAAIEESDDLNEWLARPLTAGPKSDEFVSSNATRSRYRLPVSTAGRPKHFYRMHVRPLQEDN